MTPFAERLRQLRVEKGLSQYEVAKLLHMPRSTYANYETGVREPDLELTRRFAEFFGVSVDYLLGRTSDPQGQATAQQDEPREENQTDVRRSTMPILRSTKGARHVLRIELETLPILGRIKAGIPLLSEQNIIGEVEVPSHIRRKADYALEVIGDSMMPTLAPGDIVFMATTVRRVPHHGSIVAAMIDGGEMTIKRYMKRNGGWWLVADNPAYDPIPVDGRVVIQGVYVGRWTESEGVVEPPPEEMTPEELMTRLARATGLDPDDLAEAVEFARRLKRK